MSAPIYIKAGDNERVVTSILRRNGQRFDLSGYVVVCEMTAGASTNSVTDVTVDPDQVDSRGQIVTQFATADLVAGEWTLEWVATKGAKIITFPGKESTNPVLIAE
jgi:hypothetical protein